MGFGPPSWEAAAAGARPEELREPDGSSQALCALDGNTKPVQGWRKDSVTASYQNARTSSGTGATPSGFWSGSGTDGGSDQSGDHDSIPPLPRDCLTRNCRCVRLLDACAHHRAACAPSGSVGPTGLRLGECGRQDVQKISTLTAHTFFSCALCQRDCPSLLSRLFFRLQSSCHSLTSRTRVTQAQHGALRIVYLPNIVTSHRAVSYVTSSLSITPTLGTCTPSLTLPTSLSSDPLLGELQICADLRQLERGSLAERPSFTSYEPKDHKLFTEDKYLSEYQDLAEHEDLRVKPLFFHRPSKASSSDSAERIATPPPDSDLDDDQIRALLASALYLQERGANAERS